MQNINVVQMGRGGSPLSSGAKNKLIASVVVKKNASKIQDYEKNRVFCMNRHVHGVKY